MPKNPLVSFVLATRNRGATLLHTLERIQACGLAASDYEIWVVDNHSSDGTPGLVARRRPDVHLLRLRRNRGSCAKALALPRCRAPYVVFLDDDAYPLADSIETMIEHFEADPALGAAGFTVHLAGGGQDGCALPHVFVGCGVGLRRSMLQQAGGLDGSYFMQAEEYDLSFRLLQAGFKVEMFADLHVLHLKTPQARRSPRTVFYDTRNNIMLAATFLPDPWAGEFIDDWIQRYRWLAEDAGAPALRAFRRGVCTGWVRGWWRRWRRPDSRLHPAVLEAVFGIEAIACGLRGLRAAGAREVLFADLGKNIFPYYHGAQQAGLRVAAILDDRFTRAGRRYRGIPVISVSEGLCRSSDAVVVSNSAPVHAARTRLRLAGLTCLPVHHWHGLAPEPAPAPVAEEAAIPASQPPCVIAGHP